MTITPWLFGGVEPAFQVWLFMGVAAALAGCWLDLILTDKGTPVLLPPALAPLLLALGLGLLQSTPLRTDVHRLLSPHTDLLWRQLTDDQPMEVGADSPGSSNPTLASVPSPDVVATVAAAPEIERYPISLYPASTRHDLLWLAMAVSIFLLGVLLFRSAQSRLAVLWLTAINGLALSFFGLVQQVSWNGLLFWSIPLTQGGRPFASFVNKNNAGGYLNLCLAAVVGLLVWYLGRDEDACRESMSPWDHVAYAFSRLNGRTLAALVMAGFIAAGILCSLSRGAVVAMAGATALTVLAVVVSRGLRGRALGLMAAITLGAVLIIGWIGQSDTVQQRMASLLRERQVVMHQRLPHWQTGVRAASDFWRLGSGLGTYRYIYRLYQENPDQPWFYHAENQYLEALVEGGVVGLSLMLAMIVLMALACRRLLRQNATSAAYAVGVAGVFALTSQAIASFFDFGLYIPANTLLFALICGVVAGCAANLGRHRDSVETRITIVSPPSVVNTRALAASAVALLGIAMWIGTSVARRDASYAQVRQDARDLLDATDPVPGLLARNISRTTNALAEFPDKAAAQQLSASLWTHLYRVEKTAAEQESEPRNVRRNQAWDSTSLDRLHAAIHEFSRTNRSIDLQNLRNDPLVQLNLSKARQELLTARQTCPLIPEVHVGLAELAGIDSDPNTDRVHLARARRLAPAAPGLLLYVGSLELAAGRPEAACVSWRQCLETSPGLAEQILAFAVRRMDLRRHIDDLLPNSPELLIQVARDSFAGPQYAELRQAVMKKTNNLIRSGDYSESELCYLTGAILALDDQRLQAMQQVARAVQLDPAQTAWRYQLALLFQQQGMFEKAKEQAKLCVRQEPDNKQYENLLRQLIRTRLVSEGSSSRT